MLDDHLKEPLLSDTPTTKMVIPRRKIAKLFKIAAVICVITILGILISYLASGRVLKINIIGRFKLDLDNVLFNSDSNALTFTSQNQNFLNIHFDYELKNGEKTLTELCKSSSNGDENVAPSSKCSQLKLEFKNGLQAVVSELNMEDLQCHFVEWYTRNLSSEITNCFYLEDYWYGGGGLSVHRWPLNRVNVPLQPHITQNYKSNTNKDEVRFDAFIEPYFVSSKGAAILIDHYLPLFISMNHNNDKNICFTSALKKQYTSMHVNENLVLKYLVCKDSSAKLIHQHLLQMSKIPFFHGTPDTSVLRKPLWSTRGLDISTINEAKVINLVKNIKSTHLLYSQLFIDGNYSQSPGNFFFNHRKFPRSQQLILEMSNSPEEEKFPVGAEVYPQASAQDSHSFVVQYKDNKTGGKLEQEPLFLDVTNGDAIKWFKSHLTDLSEQMYLKGFRFSGGYAMDLLHGMDQSSLITNNTLYHPNIFTQKIAEVASELKGTILIGSGYNSQTHTFIADAGPMISSWEHDKGLKSVIPTILTYGLMGYPFGLMGPVGGADFAVDSNSGLQKTPEKDLFVRWLQLMAHLPVMELSVGPWIYGPDVVNYTQSLLKFRYMDLWPKHLFPAVEEALKFGTPIARPLWWIAPQDKIAQFIDCEFILGNNLLVAPVLYDEARHRDVYLPEGSWWKDQLHGKVYKGGQWLRKYEVDLFEIATFQQVASPH